MTLSSPTSSSDDASVQRQSSVEQAPERLTVSPLSSPEESQHSYGDCNTPKMLDFFLTLDGHSNCADISGESLLKDVDESVRGIHRPSIDSYFSKPPDHSGGSKKTQVADDFGNQSKPKKTTRVRFNDDDDCGLTVESGATSNVAEVQPIRRGRFSTPEDVSKSENGIELTSRDREGLIAPRRHSKHLVSEQVQ